MLGRDIAIDGRIGGNLNAFADDFRLAGEVVGNAKIHATRIVLAPGARIGGDLLYAGPDKPEVAEGAAVAGMIRQVETDLELPFGKVDVRDWIWYVVWALLGIFLAIVLLGAALQLIAPGLLSAAANTVNQQPWGSLGLGLAVAVLVPGMAVLLMVTVVGVPIGIVTIASFVVLLALAFVAIAYCIGLCLRRLLGWTDPSPGYGSRVLWTTAGIVIFAIASLIPFIGWAVGFLAILAGIGGVIQRLRPILGSCETTTA